MTNTKRTHSRFIQIPTTNTGNAYSQHELIIIF